MGVRVTESILFRSSLSDVAQQRVRLRASQEQASTGLRINRPSDDPVGVGEATLLRSDLDTLTQLERNIVQAKQTTTATETALANTNESLIRLRELVQQALSGGSGGTQGRIIADEVEDIHDQIFTEANSQVNGSFIFSGQAYDTQPFSRSGSFTPGQPGSPSVGFVGDAGERQTTIDEGVQVRSTLNGQRVFLGDADGDGNTDTGSEDLFDLVSEVRELLVSNPDGTVDFAALQPAIDRIDTAMQQISTERTRIGSAGARLERQEQVLTEREIQLTQALSDTQDADATRVFSELVQQEAALQASLNVTARIVQPTLLNFIG